MTQGNTQSRWWERLGNVVYYFFASVTLVVAVISYITGTEEASKWAKALNSISLYYSAFALVGGTLLIELVRRLLSYVFLSRPFFILKSPRIVIVLLALSFCTALFGLVLQTAYEPSLKAEWIAQEEQNLRTMWDELQVLAEKNKECENKEVQASLEQEIQTCQLEYRKVKLNYDDCVQHLSRTTCLSFDDYEIIDCSKETLIKKIPSWNAWCTLESGYASKQNEWKDAQERLKQVKG
jgi:hypothetical protein